MGYVCGYRQQPSDRQHMGTAFTPAKTSPASWDAFRDVDAFVDAVLAELAAMAADGTRRTRSGPKLHIFIDFGDDAHWRWWTSDAPAPCLGRPHASGHAFADE